MNDFNTIVKTQFPLPIAYPFSQMEREDLSPQVKLQWLFSSFTNAMKLIGLSLEMDYLLSEADGDAKVNEAISKLRRPSLGHWNAFIRTTLKFLRRERITPFMRETLDCYRQIEGKTKVDVPGDIVDGKQQPPKPMGLISALINRRNTITHGFEALEDDDAQRMWDFCYTLYIQFLEGMRFLRDYVLYRVVEFDDLDKSKVLKLAGTVPEPEEIDLFDFDEDPEIFFKSSKRDEYQPLFPFLVRQAWINSERVEDQMLLQETVFLFEGDTGKKVVYLGPLNRKALSKTHFQVLREMLARKELDISFLSVYNLTAEALIEAAQTASSEYLEKMKERRVYILDVYQQRRQLDAHFHGFLNSIKGGFFLVGESGIGKTNLVCNLVAKCKAGLTDKDVVMLLGGASLPEQELDMQAEILRKLRVDALFHEFLDRLHELHEANGMRFVLIVDAVNEHPNPSELLRQLDELVWLSESREWWKVMYTIRDTSLRTIRRQLHQRDATFEPSPQRYYTVQVEKDIELIEEDAEQIEEGAETKESVEVPLHRLDEDELKTTYQRYKAHEGTSPKTDFELLSPSVKQIIRHPLLLRMVARVYNGQEIPRTVLLGEVLYNYCYQKLFDIEKLGPKRQTFINQFVDVLWENGLEAIEYDQLVSIPTLEGEVLNYETESAYVQLLDERILMEYSEPQPPGVPPIVKVGFVYDRMLEYLLSLRVRENLRRQGKTLDTDAIVELAETAEGYKLLAGALLHMLLSKAQAGEMVDIAVALQRSENEVLQQVTTELLVTLEELEPVNSQTTDDRVESTQCSVLIRTLLENPSEGSKDALMDFSEHLHELSSYRREEWLYEVMLTFCDEQTEPNRLAKLYNKMGLVCHIRGDYNAALQYYRQSISLEERLDDKQGLADSFNNIGRIYHTQGDYNAAFEYHQKSLSLREELGNKKGIAISLDNIGLIYKIQGDYDKALEHHQKSLSLKEELKEKLGMAQSLNNIGSIYRRQGDYDKALQYYKKSLSLREELGNKKGIAISLNNIGLIYRIQGDYNKELECYKKSLSLKEELGNKKGIAISLGNMGSVYKRQGDYDKALQYYKKSLSLREELGNKSGLATSYSSIGGIYYVRGNYDKAIEYHQKSLSLKKELSNKKGIASSYGSIGRIYGDQGDYDKALEFYKKSLSLNEELGDKLGMKISFNLIGRIYYDKGDYDKALEYYQKSLSLCEELSYKRGLAIDYNYIGRIYYAQSDYEKAFQYYQKSLSLCEELGDKQGLAINYNYIGRIYKVQGDYDKALQYYQKSLSLCEELGYKSGIATSFNNIGEVHFALDDYDTALRYYMNSLSLREELGHKRGLAVTFKNIGDVYLQQEQHQQAREFLEKSLALHQELGIPIPDSLEEAIEDLHQNGNSGPCP